MGLRNIEDHQHQKRSNTEVSLYLRLPFSYSHSGDLKSFAPKVVHSYHRIRHTTNILFRTEAVRSMVCHETRRLSTTIDKLEAMCGSPSLLALTSVRISSAHNAMASLQQRRSGFPTNNTSFAIDTNLSAQIQQNRMSRTVTCRVVENELSKLLARTPLPEIVMGMLWDKLVFFFEAVQHRRPSWMPIEISLQELQWLREEGNSRLKFHAVRDTLVGLRPLIHRLATAFANGDPLLLELHDSGAVNAEQLLYFVAYAAFGDIDEILSPPIHLRRVWKDVARARVAPEDCGKHGQYTGHLWQTSSRICEIVPTVSEQEVKIALGNSATVASCAHQKLPYVAGAHKYSLVENDPIVLSATDRGLYMQSGPSGTAYRFLTLWLVLGGSEDQLPLLRFAAAALLLNGRHHSLIEILTVCCPLLGHPEPQNILEMIQQLVPYELEGAWRNRRSRVEPGWLCRELAHSIEKLVA